MQQWTQQWRWQQLARLSACIARETLPNGGVMLHGGLATVPLAPGPGGVLLAGRSGVGKSTASRRLPPTWRSLADDVTLVDFRCYELMKVLTIFSPESFEDFPNLVEYVKRFEELPEIKAYMQSDT